MKRPYFSISGAVISGVMTAFFLLAFFFADGPEDALAPFFALIFTIVFAIPLTLFTAKIIRFYEQQKQSRRWWERDNR